MNSSPFAVLLRGRRPSRRKYSETCVASRLVDRRRAQFEAGFEQAMQQHAPPVVLDTLGASASLEVDLQQG